jgi:hypothetical protein
MTDQRSHRERIARRLSGCVAKFNDPGQEGLAAFDAFKRICVAGDIAFSNIEILLLDNGEYLSDLVKSLEQYSARIRKTRLDEEFTPDQSALIETLKHQVAELAKEMDGRKSPQRRWSTDELEFLIEQIRRNPGITNYHLSNLCTVEFQRIDKKRYSTENTVKGHITTLQKLGKLPPSPRENFWNGKFPY